MEVEILKNLLKINFLNKIILKTILLKIKLWIFQFQVFQLLNQKMRI